MLIGLITDLVILISPGISYGKFAPELALKRLTGEFGDNPIL